MDSTVENAFNSLPKDQQDAVVNFARIIQKSGISGVNAYGAMPGSSSGPIMGKKEESKQPIYEDGEDPAKIADSSKKSSPLL